MARYIDADALLQEFDIESNIHGNGLWHFTGIKAMIENQSTTFDVDKVVDSVRVACYQMGFDESQTEIIVDEIRNGGKE